MSIFANAIRIKVIVGVFEELSTLTKIKNKTAQIHIKRMIISQILNFKNQQFCFHISSEKVVTSWIYYSLQGWGWHPLWRIVGHLGKRMFGRT